jgi:subtilisin family serine protease
MGSRLAVAVAFALTISLFDSGSSAQQPGVAIPVELLATIAREGWASYLVILRERADVSGAAAVTDRNARGRFVYDALVETAERSQRPVMAALETEMAAGRAQAVRRFISVNALGVTSSEAALRRLAALPEVEQIIPAAPVSIPTPIPGVLEPGVQAVEWNVSAVRAPDVWQKGFTGQGIVVASIDTGVQFDHPALLGHYRGNVGTGLDLDHNYNWWDATGTCSSAPCDDNEHGTHVTGTMIGDDGGSNRIGVAPGATWIACKALDASGSGFLFDLLECADWILAPWDLNRANADPSKRPHIVNNSWGYSFGGNAGFRTAVQNWRAAGIFPAFAAGNTGPACGTATSPGDYIESFATGSTTMSDTISSFSSRGPSLFGGVKPDIVAPGSNVRSSVPVNGYASFSGTSMASPHSAGVVALLWSEYPNLRRDIASTELVLRQASEILNSGQGCGGDTSTAHPNNAFGWGRIDAYQSRSPFPISTDRSVYGTADSMTTRISLLNPSSTTWNVDAYLGLIMPNGQIAGVPIGTIAEPPSLKSLGMPVFDGSVGGFSQTGLYRWFTILVQPGADPGDPANHISVDVAPFTVQ